MLASDVGLPDHVLEEVRVEGVQLVQAVPLSEHDPEVPVLLLQKDKAVVLPVEKPRVGAAVDEIPVGTEQTGDLHGVGQHGIDSPSGPYVQHFLVLDVVIGQGLDAAQRLLQFLYGVAGVQPVGDVPLVGGARQAHELDHIGHRQDRVDNVVGVGRTGGVVVGDDGHQPPPELLGKGSTPLAGAHGVGGGQKTSVIEPVGVLLPFDYPHPLALVSAL